jgi:hypothetical protein
MTSIGRMIYRFTNVTHRHSTVINIMPWLLATETTIRLPFLCRRCTIFTMTLAAGPETHCTTEGAKGITADCAGFTGADPGAFTSTVVLASVGIAYFCDAAVTAATTACTVC